MKNNLLVTFTSGYWWVEGILLIIMNDTISKYFIAIILFILGSIIILKRSRKVLLIVSIILMIYSIYFGLVQSLYFSYLNPSNIEYAMFWGIVVCNFLVALISFRRANQAIPT
ncbi:MAG: hypothetical protein RR061_04260 [Muribaculaceae bacterium]